MCIFITDSLLRARDSINESYAKGLCSERSKKRMKVESAPSRKVVFREVKIPPHRMSPLEGAWMEIHTAIIEHTKQIDFVRIDTNGRRVEFKATLDAPEEILGLRKCVGLVEAFALGFELVDAIGFLVWDRLDVESFPIHFSGDRLSRAVARLESRKYAITHITNTKVLVEDSQFHMLGGAEQMLVALYMAISIMKGSSVETVCEQVGVSPYYQRILSGRL